MIKKVKHESCNGAGCYECNGYGYHMKDVTPKFPEWCPDCRYTTSFNCTKCTMYHKMPSGYSILAKSSGARSMRGQRERKLEDEQRFISRGL